MFLLGFIGVKLMLIHHIKIPSAVSLSVIAGMLVIGIAASVFSKPSKQKSQE
jgi:tellurite resistance protein TerC